MSCYAGPYNRGIVTNGLVLYYDVNEPVCYSSGRTDIQDLSRNGNAGTLVNGVGYSSDNGGSLVFDGVNDYAESSVSQLATDTMTINFWYNTDRTESQLTNYPFSLGNGTTTVFAVWVGGTFSSPTISSKAIGLWKDNSFASSTISNTFTTTDYKKWWNICVTYSSSNTKIYKNTSLLSMFSNTATGNIASHNIYQIGKRSDDVWYAKGNIPIFQIYNRALSATEIQQNFNVHRDRFGI